MDYLRTQAGTIYTELEVGENKLRLTARDIKKRGQNVSALVGIYWNQNQLEYSQINPDDMRARAGLAASAWQVIPNEYKGLEPFGHKPEILKAELALFCEGLWDAHVGRIQVESIIPRNNLPPPQFVGPYILEEGGTLLFGLPGQGKALALDTPIPTPSGWTTMGELQPGDLVFDEHGKPCNVVAVSPTWRDRPVYRFSFDSGFEIIADEEHEWLIDSLTCRACTTDHNRIQTSSEAYAGYQKAGRKSKIIKADPLELSAAALPLDPYILGVWLGDGIGRESAITQGDEDREWMMDQFRLAGMEPRLRADGKTFGILKRKLHSPLSELGLLNNKHIPPMYLRGSRTQRLALLQGLIDTDGYVSPTGDVEFVSTNPDLAYGVVELVRSLGRKAVISESRAKLYGRDCGPKWRVRFAMAGCARLPRKRTLTRDTIRTQNHYVKIEPAGRADTRCAQVDSPSHLFLAGEGMVPTHNSWCAYLLAATINSGTRNIWHSVTQKRVLFLNLERGPLQFESKMASVYRALGIQGQYPMDIINARGKTLQDVKDRVLKHIETHGNEVLFLDSLSRAGAGSMVKDDVANEVMDTLSAMCPTWLAIAHEKHADTDATGQPKGEHHTFGSQMFRGAADLEVHLESIQSPGRLAVTLTPKKSNVLIDWQPEVIYLDMDDRGVRSISRPWQEARRT